MISVIYCTREHNPKHIDHILKKFGHPNTEVIEYVNKGEGLTKYYKLGLSQAKNDIVVFMHDDVELETNQIAAKLIKLYEKNTDYGIIGVAGSKEMPVSGMWWENKHKMYGRVKHTHNGKTWQSNYSDDISNEIEDVVIVDGLFFSVHKNRIKEDFSELVKGFHFYEIDFCFRNYLQGVKIGVVTNIRVNHKSIGVTNDEWEKNRLKFSKKYRKNLPVLVPKKKLKNERLSTLIITKTLNNVPNIVNELKKSNVDINLCTVIDDKNINEIKRLKIKAYHIREPKGFRLGDGVWKLANEKGEQATSEKNNLYKLKEYKHSIIHVMDEDLLDPIKKLYPNENVMYINYDTNENNLIDKYYELI